MNIIRLVIFTIGTTCSFQAMSDDVSDTIPAYLFMGMRYTCAFNYSDLQSSLDTAFEQFIKNNSNVLPTETWKSLDLESKAVTSELPSNKELIPSRKTCEVFVETLAYVKFDDLQANEIVDLANLHETKKIIAASGGKVSRIGVSLEADKTQPVIQDVLPNSPAIHAGLMKGDVIVKIDERQLKRTSELLPNILSKPSGTVINLSILRNGIVIDVPVKVQGSEIK